MYVIRCLLIRGTMDSTWWVGLNQGWPDSVLDEVQGMGAREQKGSTTGTV